MILNRKYWMLSHRNMRITFFLSILLSFSILSTSVSAQNIDAGVSDAGTQNTQCPHFSADRVEIMDHSGSFLDCCRLGLGTGIFVFRMVRGLSACRQNAQCRGVYLNNEGFCSGHGNYQAFLQGVIQGITLLEDVVSSEFH